MLRQQHAHATMAAHEQAELARLERWLAALSGGGQAGSSRACGVQRERSCELARRTEIRSSAQQLWRPESWHVRWLMEWYRLGRVQHNNTRRVGGSRYCEAAPARRYKFVFW